MAIDPTTETNLITAKLDLEFAQKVVEGYPDATVTEYVGGKLKPYIAADYGTPVATAQNRSIGTEERQPYNIRVSVACVADSSNLARQLSSKVAAELTGFVPSVNSGALRLIGGTGGTLKFDATSPTLYISEVWFLFISNLDAD